MVIITPHIETAQPAHPVQHLPNAHIPNEAHAPNGSAGSPTDSPEASQKLKSDKNTLGVFARILAGLQNRGLQKNPAEEVSADAMPSSDGAQSIDELLSIDGEASEAGALMPVSNMMAKSVHAGKPVTGTAADAATAELLQPDGAGAIEPESHENILSGDFRIGIERLVGQPAEDSASAENGNWLENNALAAEPPQFAEIPPARFEALAENADYRQAVSEKAAAAEAGKAAENPKDGKKTNNKANFAEISANSAAKTTGEASLRQAEVKIAAADRKEGQSRLEEVRSRRRTAIEVRDYREPGLEKSNFAPVKAAAEIRMAGESAREISLDLRLPAQGHESSQATTSWEAKAGYAFEDMLARELHQNFNNDIVRHASVILREGSEGIIRLALKPESLGNVKISLELAENKITGHIVVESEEALRAFEREISDLEKAFQEAGFEAADLEMSLAADGKGAEQWQDAEASQIPSWHFAASRYDASVESVESSLAFDYYRQGTGIVNLFA